MTISLRMPILFSTLLILLPLIIYLDFKSVPSTQTASWTSPEQIQTATYNQQVAEDSTPYSPHPKPNLIVSAITGTKWVNQIFTFMESLDVAVGRRAMEEFHKHGHVAPFAPIEVKIIVPASTMANGLPPSFKALADRYPYLEFLPKLPEMKEKIVFSRFVGWSAYIDEVYEKYDKIAAMDLDILFQRDPFLMEIPTGSDVLFFAEWRGMTIGQCRYHQRWFMDCINDKQGPFVTKQQWESYRKFQRICAGSTYGTAHGMKVYLATMLEKLQESKYRCNDQAMHIHLYYSGHMDKALKKAGIGGVHLVPNEEALLGTVGTTPFVTFNEWGEVMNENGKVQAAIHQYKHHKLLKDLALRKYGWMADPGNNGVPEVPDLIVDTKWPKSTVPKGTHPGQTAFDRYDLINVKDGACKDLTSLCSCIAPDCQLHYERYTPQI